MSEEDDEDALEDDSIDLDDDDDLDDDLSLEEFHDHEDQSYLDEGGATAEDLAKGVDLDDLHARPN